MEAINQESLVSPGDIHEAPISVTTTEANLTGSWKFFKPVVQNKLSPCQPACPLEIPIPKYMQALVQEDIDKAIELLRQNNPLPATTGRVCPHFCQQECTRKGLDQEVLIGSIEQYLGDLALKFPFQKAKIKKDKKVLILGSGPAGLSAAYFLGKNGLKIRIMEKESEPGGLLRYGIPEYRLPKALLRQEIFNLIESLELELFCNQEVTPENLPELLKEHDYLFCAPGMGVSRSLQDLPESERIYQGLDLLNLISKGIIPEQEEYTIIGGGNVAVDLARSLVRLGKRAKIVYRRSRQEMPAYAQEIEQALEEGVELKEQRVVQEVIPKNKSLELVICEAVKNALGIASGRELEKVSTQALVSAIGQQAHMQIPQDEGRILTGGDYNTGPATVVQAMAQGKSAAATILHALHKNTPEPEQNMPKAKPNPDSLLLLDSEPEIFCPRLAPDIRSQSFAEANLGISKETALKAANRCLSCGTCTGCGICWYFCPDVAIRLQESEEGPQVDIDLEHCKGCGLCAAMCPRGVITMQEDR